MRVLALTNGWPTAQFPEYCVFTRRQVEDIRALGVTVEVEFVNAREKGKGEYLRSFRGLRARARGYDLVHAFHGLSFLLALAARVDRPLVVSFLNAIDNEYIDLPGPARPLAVGLTRRIVAARRPRHGIIVKDRIPPDLADHPRLRHIPNGIDIDVFQPGDKAAARAGLGLDPEAVYLLFVSSKDLHRRQKRHDRFEAVLAAARAAHPGRRIEPLTLVTAPEEVVRATYRAADVHVMTSDFEGSPNSVKEAMACGLPVVATDVGNVAAMTEGLAAARVVSPFDPQAFAAAIDAVLAASPQDRAALRAALLDRGLAAEAAARRIVDLYATMLGRAPAT